MELSLYLAKIWGLFGVLLCIGLLLNKKQLIAIIKHFEGDALSGLLAGVVTLGIGVAQVVGYESWAFNWQGLITLYGWIALLKGAAILFIPGYLEKFAKVFAKEGWYTIAFIIFLILSAYLLFMGFTA